MQAVSDRRRECRSSVLRELRGKAPQLERSEDGQLWHRAVGADDDPDFEQATPVSVHRLFPWSEPGRYVSLRDTDDEEVALVSDLLALDPASRDALERSLAEAGFVLEIVAIREVEEEIEIRRWSVDTRQGERQFQTLRDEWPRGLHDGSLLIRDVAGDLYRIAEPKDLDRASRKILWAYVD